MREWSQVRQLMIGRKVDETGITSDTASFRYLCILSRNGNTAEWEWTRDIF
jgi:hypothetical protein